jgi:hypothetical protein
LVKYATLLPPTMQLQSLLRIYSHISYNTACS